jgi:MFS family permease
MGRRATRAVGPGRVSDNERTVADPGKSPADGEPDPFKRTRPLWVSTNFLSNAGSGMTAFASSYLVYKLSGSVGQTGLIIVCYNVPSLPLAGPAVWLANRWGGPKLYVFREVSQTLVDLLPVLLYLTGHLTVASLLVYWLLDGVAAGLTSPTKTMVTKVLAAPGKLPEFNGVLTRTIAVATVVGVILGGLVYAKFGPGWIFAFNSASTLPQGLVIIPAIARAPAMARVARDRLRDGIDVLRAQPGLWAVSRFTILCFFISGYVVVLPAIAKDIGPGPNILSWLQAASLAGGIFVAYSVRKLHGRVPWGRVQRACYFLSLGGLVILAWSDLGHLSSSTIFVIALLANLPIGFALGLDSTIQAALIQASAPKRARAAVFTLYGLIPLLMVPVGQEVVGVVADLTSVPAALFLLAAVVLVLVFVIPRSPMRSAFDTLDGSELAPVDVDTVARRGHVG